MKGSALRRYGAGATLLSLAVLTVGLADASEPSAGALNEATVPPRVASSDSGGSDAESTESKEGSSDRSAAQEREQGAAEDPLAADQAKREEQRAEEQRDAGTEATERTTGFDIYGSVRIRYREQGGESDWQDGSSRAGTNIDWQFREGSFLFGRYEAGFNVMTGIERLSNPGEDRGEKLTDTIFTRLLYVGLDAPGVALLVGKNWSTYYKVADFTDRFMGTGASASGTFNAQSDGGPTGTGRADKTLQSNLSLDFLPHRTFTPFELDFQLQHGNRIPFGGGADYGTALGASAVMTTRDDFTLGLAYNHASVDLGDDPSLRDVGISGDARAALLGTRAFGERWYVGFVAARMENHETTDEGIYFDGWGSELYGQFQLGNRFWFVGGFNALEPDSDQTRARDYRVRYAVAGLRYTFDDFRRMLYANVRFDDSINADGTAGSNVYTVGIRWDLSKLGWRASK